MLISYTQYDLFWRNPEKYRLTYLLNIVPKKTPYGLARGTAFHRAAELRFQDMEYERIQTTLKQEGMEENAIQAGVVMQQFLEQESRGWIKKAAEVPYALALDEGHHLIGVLDEILEDASGNVWVGETKTANSKARLQALEEKWRVNPQVDSVLLGAQSLGYSPTGVYIRTVTETAPPNLWEICAYRTDTQLECMKSALLDTCRLIETLKAQRGVDKPWPHLSSNWPCMKPEVCEHGSICGRPVMGVPAGFALRKEHTEDLWEKLR